MQVNRELSKLKKELLKAYAPTREQELSKALRVIFQGTTEVSEGEAFKILGWDYKSKAELFEEVSKEDITVIDNGKYAPIVFAEQDFPQTEGITIFTHENML